MWAFVTGLPWWVLILVATVVAYLVYKYTRKKPGEPASSLSASVKKAIGYVPKITRGTDRIITYRDNPPPGAP